MNRSRKSDRIGLVLLAAGYGTRFGDYKQLCPIGPQNASLIDYTIFDACTIGFDWITIILNEQIAEHFPKIAARWNSKVQIHLAVQTAGSNIPEPFRRSPFVTERPKPFGTAHALLCAEEKIQGPFVVANADDWYGPGNLRKLYQFLREQDSEEAPTLQGGMIAYPIRQTLSDHGIVSRGVCETVSGPEGRERLVKINEHRQITLDPDGRVISEAGILDPETPVSMNLFAMPRRILPEIAAQFPGFLAQLGELPLSSALTKEFYLPAAVETLLEQKHFDVTVMRSTDPWFGLTYSADLNPIIQKFQQMTEQGLYPDSLE